MRGEVGSKFTHAHDRGSRGDGGEGKGSMMGLAIGDHAFLWSIVDTRLFCAQKYSREYLVEDS